MLTIRSVPYLGRILAPSLAEAASKYLAAASWDRRRMLHTRVNEKTLFDYMSQGIDVNLKMGTPPETLLRRSNEYMKKAALHRLEKPDAPCLFQYGPEAGDLRFRQELSHFLSQEYMDPVQVDDIIVTAGATQGLAMLANLLFSPGDLVFVEDPTYFIGLQALRQDCGLHCVPVPMDENGIIPEELEQYLKERSSIKPREIGGRKPFWSMLYLIPTFHNPTGVCLSATRCRRVVQIARKYNLLVVCDDVYNLLAFSQDEESALQRKRLFAYDDPGDPDYSGNVVSNASFSKLFGPGLRLGWLEAPLCVRNVILSSGLAFSGGGLNHFTSGLMTSIISEGLLQKHLTEARAMYKVQCEAVCSVLQEKLPSAMFTIPEMLCSSVRKI
ncbi:Aromatic-amino-acid aminotransferase 1 [Geodia barretti]|uniref:Aromatic-amino-acid aminotransferase 1 n=2 Tax=Geodia barretti TaxID=519541 RepID=A0AA35QYS0_GEOBA|nr:Aromatic-amino-acid aminotransferase 1 [Geodia barretti]